jgi:hypothetical protein
LSPVGLAFGAHLDPQVAQLFQHEAGARVYVLSVPAVRHGEKLSLGRTTVNVGLLAEQRRAHDVRRRVGEAHGVARHRIFAARRVLEVDEEAALLASIIVSISSMNFTRSRRSAYFGSSPSSGRPQIVTSVVHISTVAQWMNT